MKGSNIIPDCQPVSNRKPQVEDSNLIPAAIHSPSDENNGGLAHQLLFHLLSFFIRCSDYSVCQKKKPTRDNGKLRDE